MTYEYFYPGTPYSLDPEYGNLFVGYRVPAGQLGATTSIQTANQIKEVTNLLNQGITNVEVSTIQPEVFDMIPKQQLKEINRLSKLTGSETSLHAPIIDPSGFTQQGWDETNRQVAEKQFTDIVKRAQDLDPKGNMPVTIHASGVPGTEYVEWKNPETGKKEEVPQRMIAVNRESGELIPLMREKMYFPEEKGEREISPEERLGMTNYTNWTNRITNLAFYKKEADEILDRVQPQLQPFFDKMEKKEEISEEEMKIYRPALEQLDRASLFLDNVKTSFKTLYDQAIKYHDTTDRRIEKVTGEVLGNISKEWQKLAKEARDIEEKGREEAMRYKPQYTLKQSQLLDRSLSQLKILPSPQLFEPVEKFTKEKASQTLGNVAFKAYDKFGEKAPILSIENPPYGSALARAEDLKDLIEMSRQRFKEKLMEEKNMSAGQAEEAAKKLIGATWDTSHISMMRKQGFKEEKLTEEAKIIAPFVKHVHLNDNFGSTHTDLPPGMGTVPIKDILKEFEKEGFKGKKVFEGGGFFQHFQTSPHPYVLEAMGSPLYGMMAAPYWNQAAATYGSYFAGYGTMLPEQHFSLYGAGFSGMPSELGGQIPGKQSRLGGTPTA